MALKNNTRSLGNISATSIAGSEAYGISKLRLLVNLYADESNSIDNLSGVPRGYNMGALVLPLRPGGMSVFEQPTVLTRLNADAKMGINMVASSAMSLAVLNSDADQIVSGAGSSSMALTPATASLTSAVSADASAAMALTPSAELGGIIPVDASSTFALTPAVDMSALAFMDAAAGGPTPLSPEGLALSLLDNNDIEDNFSMRESLRLIMSSLAGKVSGAGTATITIRDVNDTKDRIVATVDTNGNRTAVTKDVS